MFDFGEWVLMERSKKGMTLQQLSAKSGISYPSVHKIETNKVNASLYSANRIAKALGYEITVREVRR